MSLMSRNYSIRHFIHHSDSEKVSYDNKLCQVYLVCPAEVTSSGHFNSKKTKMNIFRLPKLLHACVAFCCCQGLTVSLFAQQQKVDTARIYSIPEVTVAEAYHTREVRAMAPTQVFSKEELKSLNVLQVSDAVKHFAGVTVKDYGGIGGLKTVSLRSLGAEHTAVGYDGITISDCQTGQIDIGRFSLDNVDRLSLSNGQSDNIFQPARFFASAGILNIQTLTPQFKDNRRTNLSASFKTGSWGLVNPSLLIEQKLSRKWVLSANGEWLTGTTLSHCIMAKTMT